MITIVKPDCVWSTVKAFSGLELTKTEWRTVPAGHEAEAVRHPMLDTRQAEPEQTKIAGVKPAIKATKTAREFARFNNIDLANVTGRGSGGKITLTDVKRFIDGL